MPNYGFLIMTTSVPTRLSFRVEFMPPIGTLPDGSLDQSCVIKSSHAQRIDNLPEPATIRCVQSNSVSTQVLIVGSHGLSRIPAEWLHVPLVLYHGPARVRITGMTSDGTAQWQRTLDYTLPSDSFPQRLPSKTWAAGRCSLTIEEGMREPVEYHGEQQCVLLATKDAILAVQMCVQMVRHATTLQPLSLFRERVYAVREMCIIGDISIMT